MKLSIPAGTTSKRIALFIQDSNSTTGAGLTGLSVIFSGLTCYSWVDTDGNVNATQQTLTTMTRGTWVSGGFVAKDTTNMPGFYEFGVPNALLASGVRWAVLLFKATLAPMAPLPVEIEVTATSNQDAVAGGMTNINNLPSNIKKNTALPNFHFVMISSTDHVTLKSGLGASILGFRTRDGLATESMDNTPTEISNGLYRVDLTAADLNADVVTFGFAATGADNRFITIITRP